ncbi:hypothetical protein [Nocardia sp. NBC_00403]
MTPKPWFYLELLGGRLLQNNDGSAGIGIPFGLIMIAQKVPDHAPPFWP